MSSASVLATSDSDGERPSRTALVESPISASTPSSPSAVSFAASVGAPMIGVGSIFQSPVCSTVPAGVRIASALDSGIEWATLMKSIVNGPSVSRPPSGTTLTGICGAPGSDSALGFEQGRRERRGVERHLEARPQIDQRAHMIFVAVGEDEADDVFAFLDQIADVRQDKIDAGQMLLGGKGHAAIDDEPFAAVAASPKP